MMLTRQIPPGAPVCAALQSSASTTDSVCRTPSLNASQCRSLQNTLCKLIDPEKDSLRFYYRGNRYESKIEHFGSKPAYNPEDPMIL